LFEVDKLPSFPLICDDGGRKTTTVDPFLQEISAEINLNKHWLKTTRQYEFFFLPPRTWNFYCDCQTNLPKYRETQSQ